MGQQINPLRQVATQPFSVEGGSANLVANGIYSVDDIVQPILTEGGVAGDPRVYSNSSERRTNIRWRTVNRDGWISPKAKATNDKDTVIQVRFARERRFNRLNFELLRVPQTFSVKYYDSTRKQMVVLTDSRGQRVTGSLSGFKNNVLTPNQEANNSHKWRLFEYRLPTIKTSLIELHLNRDTSETAGFFDLPTDTPYSLGTRNISMKLHVSNDDDVDPGDDGTPTPIGTVETPKVERYTSINAHDDKPYSYWECAPQGAANSVVPFYIDMRADEGSATVFDRLKLVPLWTGPTMTVYWSNDDVATPWASSPNRGQIIREGDARFAKDSGLVVDAVDDAWTISNGYVKLDLAQSFSVGLLYQPTDTNTAGDRYLWTFERAGEELSLRFSPTANGANTMTGTFDVVRVSGGSTTLFSSAEYDLDKGTQYGVVLGYTRDTSDPSSTYGWHLAFASQPATDSVITTEADDTTALTGFVPTDLTFGSNALGDLDSPMYGYISRLWVRMDTWSDPAARAFLKSPDIFIAGEGDATQRTNGFYNAVLIAKLALDAEARVGPGAGYYRNKVWTPIPVDYSLDSDQYLLPVTSAKFLKLEFTNLYGRTYLTQEETLPVTAFPTTTRDYYRENTTTSRRPYALTGGRDYYEVGPRPRTPGDSRIMPEVRSALDRGSSGGVPTTIYSKDMGTTDLVTNPSAFDSVTRYEELRLATTPMRFITTGRHEYETTEVQAQQHAFFVGIKDLQVMRTDHSIQFDSREYNETYDDEVLIASSTNWTDVGAAYQASATGAQLVSKTLESYSNFETAQVAVIDSGWESGFSDDQNDLGTIAHLVDPTDTALASSTSTVVTTVTGRYRGARGGNVIEVNRAVDSTDTYGVRTDTGVYQDTLTEDGGARTSAVVRMQLPATNKGDYRLRLYAGGEMVSEKRITIPVKTWKEIETAYISRTGDTDWQVEIVQVNPLVSEPIVVDMMGIWQNAIRWEISNDNGSNYWPLLWPLNNPRGYVRFVTDDYRLKVRATALRVNAVVSGWTVVPWYIESPMVMRAPIDYLPPWGQSDQQDLLDTSRKPLFQLWSRFFPQRFSVNLYGYW